MAKLIDRIKGLFSRAETGLDREARAELDHLASLHYEAVDYDQLPELERMEAEILTRAPMEAENRSSEKSTFQVWHAADPFAVGAFGRSLGLPVPLFPHDYRRVATVDAKDVEGAFRLTNHDDLDWRENPAVSFLGGDGRSTSVGDVVVDPDGNAHRVENVGFAIINPATDAVGIERALAAMKAEPEILLESTRHFVMDDPTDAESVYDTCDVLGPWEGLNPTERLAALHELEWRGVGDDDKRRIISREVDLSRVRASDRERYFGDLLTEPHKGQDARMDSDPLERARQRARDDVQEKGRDRGMEIG